MNQPLHVVILAAGLGTRMKSKQAKVLHQVCGLPMVHQVASLAQTLNPLSTTAVVGHQAEQVTAALKDLPVGTALQAEQKGTGHALMCAADSLKDKKGWLLLLSGDVPLLTGDTLQAMLKQTGPQVGAVVLTTKMENPFGYGRIVRDSNNHILRIVEEKDADSNTRAISEINAGVYLFRLPESLGLLDRLGTDNAAGEYYLTDLLPALRDEGWQILPMDRASSEEVLGVNSRQELAQAEAILQQRINRQHMKNGVTMLNPGTTRIESSVSISRDVILHGGISLCGKTTVGEDSVIESGCQILDSTLGLGVHLKPNCVLNQVQLGNQVTAGPFAHLRPGTQLGDQVKIGNFVETKKAHFHEGAKASHLSYLGDCEIGAGSNIGAGTITCNYDGTNKHRTELGKDVFVGSDTQLVAPVKIGDGAIIGAGTTVTKDVPAGSLAISRQPQKNIAGYAERKNKKAKKA